MSKATTEKRQLLASAAASESIPKPVTTEPGDPSAPGGHLVPVPHPGHGQSRHTTPPPTKRGLYEWTARIECKKFELCSSYSVIIFLGLVPDDPNEWQVSDNYVGSHYAFVAEECENRRGKADVVTEGFVHLNQAIIRHSGLHSLKPDGVEPYLTNNLHWRVLKVDGEPGKLDSLEVTVYATPLSFPPGSNFPVPGEPHRYDGITYGQDGGSRHAPTH